MWSKGYEMKLKPTQTTQNPAGQAIFTTKTTEGTAEYQRFATLATALIAVPKSEIDEKKKKAKGASSR